MNPFPTLLTQGYMINNVNESVPAVTDNKRTAGPSLSVGQLGSVFQFDETLAARYSDTSIGTLKGCKVQLVQLVSTASAAAAVGRPAFVSDLATFKVTTDMADNTGMLAGFFLNIVTAGNIGFLAVAGYVPVKYGTITKSGGAAAGDHVYWVSASSVGTGDTLADATTAHTANLISRIIGRAFEAATNGQTKMVRLFHDLSMPHNGITG